MRQRLILSPVPPEVYFCLSRDNPTKTESGKWRFLSLYQQISSYLKKTEFTLQVVTAVCHQRGYLRNVLLSRDTEDNTVAKRSSTLIQLCFPIGCPFSDFDVSLKRRPCFPKNRSPLSANAAKISNRILAHRYLNYIT